MPDPYNVTIQNRTYLTPVLNGEMDNLIAQMNDKKSEIASLNSHLNGALAELKDLEKQFLAIYIQQTGSFPS